jgi:CrcB protein
MAVDRTVQSAFPWGTFAVNMLGCLLFGLVYSVFEQRLEWPGDTRGIVLTGFMGASTTYSTFAYNTGELLRESQWVLAAANIVSQNVLGIALLFAGLALGRSI